MKINLPSWRPSLRAKLLMLNALVAAALISLSVQAWLALNSQQQAQARQVQLSEAQHLSKQADVMFDAMRADVLASMLIGQVPDLDPFETRQRVRDDGMALYETLQTLSRIDLGEGLKKQVRRTAELAQAYAMQTHQVVEAAVADRAAALATLPALDKQYKLARAAVEAQGDSLGELMRKTQAESTQDAEQARQSLLWVCAATLVAASAVVALVTVAIQRRLRWLSEVAQSMADGNMARRAGEQGSDELGDLGRAVDKMASGLSTMIGTMREDAVRASFGKHLAEALDMADAERQVTRVAARAMNEISPEHQMELLIADSSKANMERAAEHPVMGASGCNVGSPYDCVAVRRGNIVSFNHSEDLQSCTHLRGRPCGDVSAVCMPVTFMGHAIGVLHTTGPAGAPLSAEQSQQLSTLGTQIGMRIGTVRAFEKSQIQASTDGLTGLPNRRTLEQQLRVLGASDRDFVFVMCDLDHFKLLNDGHGHATGDAALRLFSDVMRHSLRESDLLGRWGGEEFAFVLVDSNARAAVELVDRLRKRLAQTLQLGKCPPFTCSFGVADTSMARVPDQLIRMADVALYQAKATGRDRACIADGGIAAADIAVHASDRPGSNMNMNSQETVNAV